MSWSSSLGVLPTFEKRSAIVLRRSTSLPISSTVWEGTVIRRISCQAARDEIGVPSWWAVSLERPTQTFSSSRFFSTPNIQMRRARNIMMSIP